MIGHDFEHMRIAMVASQLRTTGIADAGVLAAMGAVPRERFVPEQRVAAAYADTLVPLGSGRYLNSPMSTGRLLSESSPQAEDRALVVGAATGYAAAVLAELVRSVVAVEEDPELAAFARGALEGTKVEVVEGPLTAGHSGGAPYDLILIDGAVDHVPQAIIDQLADGGRLAVGIAKVAVSELSVGRRGGGGFGLTAFSDASSALLPGFVKPRGFVFETAE
jgi:protein-L-isoaspartate(D-aspartate) O-methyltransferase